MQARRTISCVAIMAVGMLFLGALPASSELPLVQGAPATSNGFETLKSQIVDLGPEISAMAGRQLRLRLLRIAPGGHIEVHDHANRPAVFYVIAGATTVIYGDGTARRFSAGSTGYANRRTVHWHKNNEMVPVVIVAADIFQPNDP